jgi:S1-C subfamily serine protease
MLYPYKNGHKTGTFLEKEKRAVRQVNNCKWRVLTAHRLCIHMQIIVINLANNKEVLAKFMAWYNFTDNALVSI